MQTRRKRPLGKRIAGNLKAKWVQVLISAVSFAVVLWGSHLLLVKKKPVSEAEKKKQAAEFQFMHCDKCFKEMTYIPDLANKPALACKCKPGDGGFWTPTKESIGSGSGGGDDTYRWFYTAVFVESLLWLGVLYYLLARKDDTPQFFFVRCVHCRELLRFTPAGFGLLVGCPNCEQPIRLPEEEEAMTRDDHNDEQAEHVIGQFEGKLRESGFRFPGEEDPEAEVEAAEPNTEADPPRGA